MAKVRLTNNQLKLLESHFSMNNEKMEGDLSYIDEQCDKLYRTIMSSTLLEIVDGDLDIDNHIEIMKRFEEDIDKTISNNGGTTSDMNMHPDEMKDRDRRVLDRYNKVKVLKSVLETAKQLSDFNTDKKVNKVFGHKTAKIRG